MNEEVVTPSISPEFSRVAVVGGGVMGAGIVDVLARSGCDVVLVEISADALEAARSRVAASLGRAARGGLDASSDDAMARIRFTTDIADVSDCSLVVEAVRETLEDKATVIGLVEQHVAPSAVVASNTSSIPIARLASASSRPENVVGMHFFNPAPVMPVVEITPSLLTADEVTARLSRFVAETLGKTPLRTPDRAGFLVNALLVPYLLAAVRALQNGVGTRDDIDAGMMGGCGMPMGPLRLCDLIGLDTLLLVAESLHAEHLAPEFVAPSLLRRHVDAGLLGKKTGQGFYRYEESTRA